MQTLSGIEVIAFDADDTLWLNEPLFTRTQEKCKEIIRHYVDPNDLEEQLYQRESNNLKIFGYGVKGFTLSLIETTIELTEGRINGEDIQQLIDLGKDMIEHPIELLPGVEETVNGLKDRYQLMIITKGDLFHQESKIARSGLAPHFKHIEIVSEKNPDTYREILKRYEIDSKKFLMIGNSLKSDILPVCEIGGRAIHVPYHTTWVHEEVKYDIGIKKNYVEIQHITRIFDLLAKKDTSEETNENLIDLGDFVLRSFYPEDAPSIARNANNKNVSDFLPDRFPYPYTEENARDYILLMNIGEREKSFAIAVDGEVVGAIGLIYKKDIYSHTVELGYWLGEDYWGRGIVSRAAREVVRYGFEVLGKERIIARVVDKNKGSIRVLEKNGFRKEGIGKDAVLKNGEWQDMHYFGLTKADFL